MQKNFAYDKTNNTAYVSSDGLPTLESDGAEKGNETEIKFIFGMARLAREVNAFKSEKAKEDFSRSWFEGQF